MQQSGRWLTPLMRIYYRYAETITRIAPTPRVDGVKLDVLPSVCRPVGGWEELADFVPAGKDVLELGSGSGHLTIALAKKSRSVTATDISPVAVENTRRNVAKWDLANVVPLVSDAFASVEGTFDVIAMNPPWMNVSFPEPERQWATSSSLVPTVLRESCRFLNRGGRLVFSYPGEHADEVVPLAEQHGLTHVGTHGRTKRRPLGSRLLELAYLNVGLDPRIFVFQKEDGAAGAAGCP